VDTSDQTTHLGAEAAHHGCRGRFEHGHLATPGARRGCYFETDEPGADDDHPTVRRQFSPQPESIIEGSQRVDTGPVGLAGKPADTGSRCDHQPVEGNAPPGGETDLALFQIEEHCGISQTPLGVQSREIVGSAQTDAIGFPFTREQLLRQRRSVVRHLRLAADDRHRTGEGLLAQSLGRTQAGQGRTDHHDPLQREHLPTMP
jgi:hypothetical protein